MWLYVECVVIFVVVVKQKTAYEVRISDWSSDVCSSDLQVVPGEAQPLVDGIVGRVEGAGRRQEVDPHQRRAGDEAGRRGHRLEAGPGEGEHGARDRKSVG